MKTAKNILFGVALLVSSFVGAMQLPSVVLSKAQAKEIKQEVSWRFDRDDEKYYVIDKDVMNLIKANVAMQDAFNACKNRKGNQSIKDLLEDFALAVDAHVQEK